MGENVSRGHQGSCTAATGGAGRFRLGSSTQRLQRSTLRVYVGLSSNNATEYLISKERGRGEGEETFDVYPGFCG